MTDALVLTFAEIEFLLTAFPGRADEVRADLRLEPSDQGAAVERSGLASLLTRGLCTASADPDPGADGTESVVPGWQLKTAVAAFATARQHVAVAGWRGDRPDVMYLYSGDATRMALFPDMWGRYTVEFLEAEEPLSAPLLRFVDVFASYSAEGRESALVVRSRGFESAEADAAEVSLAVAIDAAGSWMFSDSLTSADRGIPASRDVVARRVSELMDQPRGGVVGTPT